MNNQNHVSAFDEDFPFFLIYILNYEFYIFRRHVFLSLMLSILKFYLLVFQNGN